MSLTLSEKEQELILKLHKGEEKVLADAKPLEELTLEELSNRVKQRDATIEVNRLC